MGERDVGNFQRTQGQFAYPTFFLWNSGINLMFQETHGKGSERKYGVPLYWVALKSCRTWVMSEVPFLLVTV